MAELSFSWAAKLKLHNQKHLQPLDEGECTCYSHMLGGLVGVSGRREEKGRRTAVRGGIHEAKGRDREKIRPHSQVLFKGERSINSNLHCISNGPASHYINCDVHYSYFLMNTIACIFVHVC